MSTAIYTLPLHAALPICRAPCVHVPRGRQVMNQQRTSVPVIELTDVHVVHKLRTGGLLRPDTIRAVDGVSASVRRGEIGRASCRAGVATRGGAGSAASQAGTPA